MNKPAFYLNLNLKIRASLLSASKIFTVQIEGMNLQNCYKSFWIQNKYNRLIIRINAKKKGKKIRHSKQNGPALSHDRAASFPLGPLLPRDGPQYWVGPPANRSEGSHLCTFVIVLVALTTISLTCRHAVPVDLTPWLVSSLVFFFLYNISRADKGVGNVFLVGRDK